MFILVTIATLLWVASFHLFHLGQALPASNPSSFAVFGSLSWKVCILYLLWLSALLSSLVPRGERPSVLQNIARFGANSNMQVLQLLLLAMSFVIASSGWLTGNTILFIPGVITTLGLLGNAIEQRSLVK